MDKVVMANVRSSREMCILEQRMHDAAKKLADKMGIGFTTCAVIVRWYSWAAVQYVKYDSLSGMIIKYNLNGYAQKKGIKI